MFQWYQQIKVAFKKRVLPYDYLSSALPVTSQLIERF